MSKRVGIDFDDTLTRPDVEEFVRDLIEQGIEIFIITARYNHMMRHKWDINPCNEDLFNKIKSLRIPERNVVFCNMELKSKHIEGSGLLFLLDDNPDVIKDVSKNSIIPIIDVTDKNWMDRCLELLK